MGRGLQIAAAVLVAGAAMCLAEDSPTVPPAALPAAPPPGVRPSPVADDPAGSEPSAELLLAQVEVRKAHVRAAEVGLRGAKSKLDRISRARATGAATAEDAEQAGLEVDAAAAQLDIRKAEVGEAEARLKRAKDRPAAGKPAGGRAVGVFNMAAVMRGYDKAKYLTHLLNQKRISESAAVTRKRDEYKKAEQRLGEESADDAKEKIAQNMRVLAKQIQDEDARINQLLNGEASAIIARLYDELKAVVDETAEKNGYLIVLAYPDAVTDDEKNNAYLKELKLKPPAAQPFFVSQQVDITDAVLKTLNAKYPALDANGNKVDTSKLTMPALPTAPSAPKRD